MEGKKVKDSLQTVLKIGDRRVHLKFPATSSSVLLSVCNYLRPYLIYMVITCVVSAQQAERAAPQRRLLERSGCGSRRGLPVPAGLAAPIRIANELGLRALRSVQRRGTSRRYALNAALLAATHTRRENVLRDNC